MREVSWNARRMMLIGGSILAVGGLLLILSAGGDSSEADRAVRRLASAGEPVGYAGSRGADDVMRRLEHNSNRLDLMSEANDSQFYAGTKYRIGGTMLVGAVTLIIVALKKGRTAIAGQAMPGVQGRCGASREGGDS